ncbi:MAG: hypothetical protein GVY17_03010 [Cyanobacteria bacterium]|jgi:hypothetical protein|nr:hypothetical protein [Cyanobacteria bacterium GSL.Bin21]
MDLSTETPLFNDLLGTSEQDTLIGTDAAERLIGLAQSDRLTGGAGGDQFVYLDANDGLDVITDFAVGIDQLVFSQLLNSIDYDGNDPIAEGYLSVVSEANGARVSVDLDGPLAAESPQPLVLVNNVSADELLGNEQHFVVSADAVVMEESALNQEFTAQNTVTGIDLLSVALDADSDQVLTGQTTVTFTVKNQGTVEAGTFAVDLVYSDDEVLGNSDDQVIETVALTGLAAGETLTETVALQLPVDLLNSRAQADDPPELGAETVSTSSDFLGIVIDSGNEIAEADETNNLGNEKGLGIDDITYFPWDIDGSGIVTSSDAIFVINRLGESVPPADARADLDGNGLIISYSGDNLAQAINSGTLDISNLETIPVGTLTVLADGTSSVVNVANIAGLVEEERNGGTVNLV